MQPATGPIRPTPTSESVRACWVMTARRSSKVPTSSAQATVSLQFLSMCLCGPRAVPARVIPDPRTAASLCAPARNPSRRSAHACYFALPPLCFCRRSYLRRTDSHRQRRERRSPQVCRTGSDFVRSQTSVTLESISKRAGSGG